MLTLSLFRGFGLLTVCAPTYMPLKRRPPMPLTAPTVKGDLLADARKLLREGHTSAAAMIARVEIERQLTNMVIDQPAFGKYWIGAPSTACWLRKHRFFRLGVFETIVTAIEIGNDAAHGQAVTNDGVGRMFNAIDALRYAVARKEVAV